MKRSEIILRAAVNFSYFALFLILLPFFRYQINPDSISLINISQKYLAGECALAVNGYWPPLVSWLLMPFILIFSDAVLSFKILSLFIGLFALFSFGRLLDAIRMEFRLKAMAMAVSVIGVLYFSMVVASSDFLTASVMIFYLSIVIGKDAFKSKRFFLKAGAAGFVLYLSKTYGFFFFLSHFTVISAIEFFASGERKRILAAYASAVGLFLMLSLLWIVPISVKYGEFTVGTTGKFNYASFGPVREEVRGPYVHAMKLPDTLSTSNWDDPSDVYPSAWNPFSSADNMKHQIKLLRKNVPWFLDLLNSFSYLSLLIILSSFVMIFMKRRRRENANLLAALFLSAAGYILIAFEQRYLWVNFFVLIAMAAIAIDSAIKKENVKNTLFAIIMLTFLIMPARNLYSDLNINKDIYEAYQEIKPLAVKGNTGSDSNRPFMTILSFYMKNHYFGAFGKEIDSETFKTELKENDIEYYFMFDEESTRVYDALNENYELIYRTNKFRILRRINE
ncbi:MAG: hypothetical protein PHW02_05365 [bacterium]|nr:hypothetical protein [bacterium]